MLVDQERMFGGSSIQDNDPKPNKKKKSDQSIFGFNTTKYIPAQDGKGKDQE